MCSHTHVGLNSSPYLPSTLHKNIQNEHVEKHSFYRYNTTLTINTSQSYSRCPTTHYCPQRGQGISLNTVHQSVPSCTSRYLHFCLRYTAPELRTLIKSCAFSRILVRSCEISRTQVALKVTVSPYYTHSANSIPTSQTVFPMLCKQS